MENDIRIMITITKEEKAALIKLAELQRRDPRDQAAILINQELISYGLIPWRPLTFFQMEVQDPDDNSQLLLHG